MQEREVGNVLSFSEMYFAEFNDVLRRPPL